MDLTALPELPLEHLTEYLEGSDLQNLSAASKKLRNRLNSNKIWERVTQRGKHLSKLPCVVEPAFQPPPSGPLPPLCENRIHYLRQCRLVHNYRNSMFSYGIIDCSRNVLNPSNYMQTEKKCIFNDKYFIIFQFYEGGLEIAYLFDIEKPCYVSSCAIPKSTNIAQPRYFWSCHAEKNHILILRPYGIDVYNVWFDPFRMSLRHYIETPRAPNYKNIKLYSPYLFMMDESEYTLHVWNMYSGKLVKKIYSKRNEPCYYVLQSSQDHLSCPENALFDVGRPHLHKRVIIYGFDIKTLQISQFNIIWNVQKTERVPFIYSQGQLVALLVQKLTQCSIYLYDFRKSAPVSEKRFKIKYVSRIKILEGSLIVATDRSLLIMNSENLETLWELSHYSHYHDIIYWTIENKYPLLVLKNRDVAEVWDFTTRKRVKEVLPFFETEEVMHKDSTLSRVVNFSEHRRELVIYTFW